jgi:hypothetical protein
MKVKLLIAAMLLGLNTSLQADQCQLTEVEPMAKVLNHIKPNSVYVEFCEPCGDKDFFSREQQTVKSITVEQDADYWSLKLNGKEVDLAYTFVKNKEGSFINLSKLAECPSSDVSVGFTPEKTK